MAEQIPYGVVANVITNLASAAFREFASGYGVENEIDWLKGTVEDIKAVLLDADQKQQSDTLIQRWISRLKLVLYDADDLLDELHTQHLLRQRDGHEQGMVSKFCSSLAIAHKIKEIKERFNDVAEKMSKLGLDRRVAVETKREKCINWRETSSVHGENIIGREESQMKVVDLLLNSNNNNENVSLVAIVGIGGLGKTALAQLVYNNHEVNQFFNKRMWVCVSEDFDVTALVRKILETSIGKAVEEKQLQLLQGDLRENLKGQRYLLVLDDVWNEDRRKWSELKKYLICGAQGSKILVTTRDQKVTDTMGVKMPYCLEGLNTDQSWNLLRKLAFGEDKTAPRNLESIGREIAEKCAGVPLAIRAVGSLLESKPRRVGDWKAMLEGNFWKSRDDNNSIMPILKLSYDSLAIELKQCFAYCSLYPKDWEYSKNELIYLWMAQGFLEKEDQCPEDVGEEYVRILLMKSFLQDVKTDQLGEIRSFKMHDLMHDLSQSIASSDHYLYVRGKRNDVSRHLIHASFEEYNPSNSPNLLDPSRLRTFLEIEGGDHETDPSYLSKFKRLRSLDLSFNGICLAESIGEMSHLRYLNLSSCYELTCLPKGISNLINLQTLILSYCFDDLEFGGDIITTLINLRRLDIEGCKAFEDGMPIGLEKMTKLQRLSNFIVGNDDEERKKAKLNELKELNLRGSLVIENLHLVMDVEEESKDVNLATKENLTSLTLKWGQNSEMKDGDAKRLLDNLHPHENLEALKIDHYPGVYVSDWLSLCRELVKLELSFIENCKYLPELEGLVSLKTLSIYRMPKLEYIYYKGSSSSADFFPSLEELKIEICGSLKGWRLREANDQNMRDDEWHHSLPPFSRLSSLLIFYCGNLSCMPTFPNLVRRLELSYSRTKPLLDTIATSTSNSVPRPLSMLKHLHINGLDLESFRDDWMRDLSSLTHLSFLNSSSPEKLFCCMQSLTATLETLAIGFDSWDGDAAYNRQWHQDLPCLHSLQVIKFCWCLDLKVLPDGICDLQSLRSILIMNCNDLESFPERMNRLTNLQTLYVSGTPLLHERCKRESGAEWPKIAHIPDIRIHS